MEKLPKTVNVLVALTALTLSIFTVLPLYLLIPYIPIWYIIHVSCSGIVLLAFVNRHIYKHLRTKILKEINDEYRCIRMYNLKTEDNE